MIVCDLSGKQCRSRSDCSIRSSLIWVCTVCSDLSVSLLRMITTYSRTSMAQTLMACLSWLFHPLAQNAIAADLELFRVIFFSILKMICCVYSLEWPH